MDTIIYMLTMTINDYPISCYDVDSQSYAPYVPINQNDVNTFPSFRILAILWTVGSCCGTIHVVRTTKPVGLWAASSRTRSFIRTALTHGYTGQGQKTQKANKG